MNQEEFEKHKAIAEAWLEALFRKVVKFIFFIILLATCAASV